MKHSINRCTKGCVFNICLPNETPCVSCVVVKENKLIYTKYTKYTEGLVGIEALTKDALVERRKKNGLL